ncbi:Hypothetical predicted protein [Mytilus galloprovincialis]|uniref:YqaJ viral recombinase domain-containing protein n=1 Tax=Mytilus galloprovincialis TaxID=29158 RepID=A0A8B6EWF9_MYTGA|nr:Hypothetical predicted protein [Mytilus galloprovincialis]
MFNHCNHGSWHTRCYGAALRFNRGPKWSTSTWQDITNTIPGYHFDKLFTERQLALENNNIIKSKPEIKSSRWKRKMASVKEGNTKKARMHYGNQSIQVEEDITKSELEEKKTIFMKKNYNLELSHIKEIEKHTKLQLTSASWMNERKKRLTASNFGLVYKRNPKIPVTPLVNSLLYSTFKGNKATRFGLREERVTIQEYIQQKAKQKVKLKVENMGLVDEEVQFLGASPDGKVIDEHNEGLIEIKNILHNKVMTLLQATSSIKTFCLEKNNNELKLKKTHNYFYQCQGLMNICKLPWIDFIVRTTNLYDINIEGIYRDSVLWEQNLLPKLKAFFLNAMLPELTHPRHNKYPGIREPGRRITHEWILEDRCKNWFKGLVLSVLKKSDGDVNAVYEIKYNGEDDANEVEHKELLEDYRNSS